MKKKKPKTKILFAVCLIVLVAAVAVGITYKVRQNQRGKIYDELADSVISDPLSSEPEEGEQTQKPEIPVDFEALQEENGDIYAWIRIPDTVINYPILQSPGDDDYYMNHTVEDAQGLPGAIYTQYSYNSGCFEDPVTVIYGHNMRNGSMFASVRNYEDEEYKEEHPEIYIYTPEHILTYRVAFGVTYDDRHILYTYDCSTTEGYESMLASFQTERLLPSWLEDPFTVTAEDRMILLSTCNSTSGQRFIVGAVLINEE